MNNSARSTRLHQTDNLLPGVLLATLILLPTPLQATPLQELRLFYEPTPEPIADTRLNDTQSNDARQSHTTINASGGSSKVKTGHTPVIKSSVSGQQSAAIADKQRNNVYRYTGFISSAAGQHYLINGRPLSDIHSLVLA